MRGQTPQDDGADPRGGVEWVWVDGVTYRQLSAAGGLTGPAYWRPVARFIERFKVVSR